MVGDNDKTSAGVIDIDGVAVDNDVLDGKGEVDDRELAIEKDKNKGEEDNVSSFFTRSQGVFRIIIGRRRGICPR